MKRYDNSGSEDYFRQLSEILPAGRHSNFAGQEAVPRVYYTAGAGSRLWDADGNEYLDLDGQYGAIFLGHSVPIVQDQMAAALKRPVSLGSGESLGVCRKLKQFIPCCEMARFGLGGTEMIQNSLRLARAYTQKYRFIKFQGHYHGSADNILGGKTICVPAPLVYEDKESPYFTEGRFPGIFQEQTLQLSWNKLDELEQTLYYYHSQICAVIMEPFGIHAGGIQPAEGYLEGVRELCDKYHVVLIFDELVTGVRMGLGGAQEVYGVTPDLCIMGNALTSGIVPLTVLAGRKELMSLYQEQRVIHGGHYNGYGLGMSAANAVLTYLEKDEQALYHNLSLRSHELRTLLEKAAENAGISLVTQGPDACFAYHCTDRPLTSYQDLTEEISSHDRILHQCLLSHGIACSYPGIIFPSLSLDADDIEFFHRRLPAVMKDAVQKIRSM